MSVLPPKKRQFATDRWSCVAEVDGVKLRLAEPDDAEFILGLRLNPLRNKHLSRVENDIDAQKAWLNNYKNREKAGDEFYFIIRNNGGAVGTLRIYDFRGPSFCWGSWIITPGLSTRIALASVYLVYKLAFDILGFQSSHFDVRIDNVSVNRFHQRMGAVLTSSDDANNYYTILKESVVDYFLKYGWGFDECR
jgi:RimJ/RimL family protein N-acetyltransferase